MHLFLCEITHQTVCLRAELFTLAARLLLSQGFPSSAGLPFVQEDAWSSLEKHLPPFPLPPDLYSHVTRQRLLMCKWGFSTVLWKDSFIASIMSAFIFFHGRGRVVALFCLVAALTFTLPVWPFGVPRSCTGSTVSCLALSSLSDPVQGLCSPTFQKNAEPQVTLWWTVPRKKAKDVLDAYRLPKTYFWTFYFSGRQINWNKTRVETGMWCWRCWKRSRKITTFEPILMPLLSSRNAP